MSMMSHYARHGRAVPRDPGDEAIDWPMWFACLRHRAVDMDRVIDAVGLHAFFAANWTPGEVIRGGVALLANGSPSATSPVAPVGVAWGEPPA